MADPTAPPTNGAAQQPVDPDTLKAQLAKAQADAVKAAADARAAEVAARKAEREEAERSSAAALNRREAIRDKQAAEAGKDAGAARQAEIAALIPDFSKVDRGSLDVKGDQALFGSALGTRALDHAAKTIATIVIGRMTPKDTWKVLVSSEVDLASADASYVDVTTGLDELIKAAEKLLAQTKPTEPGAIKPQGLPLIGALAAAVPGVLSLFSSHRTVTTTKMTIGNVAAAAAVAGALKGQVETGTVAHDQFRLVPTGDVRAKLDTLAERRRQLTARKVELDTARTSAASGQAQSSDTIARLQAALAQASGSTAAIEAQIEQARADRRRQDAAQAIAATLVGMVDAGIEAIDAFVTALRTVPQGARRSPLTAAALHEQIHQAGGFTHVLLVQSQNGSASQVIDDKPLFFDDKFSVIAGVSVTYMLLAVPEGTMIAAGNAEGTASAKGKIGGEFTIDPT
jgi:hypothetical protein